MNRIQSELIEIMRSGEIPEGRNISNLLCPHPNQYSLSGAICELYRRHHPESAHWHQKTEGQGPKSTFVCEGRTYYTIPPQKVTRWMGLRNEYGAVGHEDPPLLNWGGWPVRNLTAAYECGLTFSELADLMEEKSEDIFMETSVLQNPVL